MYNKYPPNHPMHSINEFSKAAGNQFPRLEYVADFGLEYYPAISEKSCRTLRYSRNDGINAELL